MAEHCEGVSLDIIHMSATNHKCYGGGGVWVSNNRENVLCNTGMAQYGCYRLSYMCGLAFMVMSNDIVQVFETL